MSKYTTMGKVPTIKSKTHKIIIQEIRTFLVENLDPQIECKFLGNHDAIIISVMDAREYCKLSLRLVDNNVHIQLSQGDGFFHMFHRKLIYLILMMEIAMQCYLNF